MKKLANDKLLVACSAMLILAGVVAGCIPPGVQPATTSQPPATTQVVQTTLVETRSLTGELSYGALTPLRDAGLGSGGFPRTGTLTWFAPAGSTVERGEALFKVDEQAVISFYGDVPMYRTLEEGAQGTDVLQLEQNLAELGYTGYTYVNIDVLSNDQGTGMRVASVTAPANGRAVIHDDNTITYTPAPGFTGMDSFRYTAIDSSDLSDSSIVTVVVLPVAPPALPNGPTAHPDVAATFQEERVTVQVLDNDQGDDLLVTWVENPGHGQALINSENTIAYTPEPGFTGVDTFRYTVIGAGGLSASAQVAVVVSSAALPSSVSGPLATPDVAITLPDTPDSVFTTATTEAVKAWQAGSGLTVTGIINPGQVTFMPGPVRIAGHTARLGEAVGGSPVLTYTGLDRIVTVPLRVTDLALADEGNEVAVTLPNGDPVAGMISQISAVVNNGTVDVTVTIADQQSLGSLAAAPVDVKFISQERQNVLAVPISALLALAEGGYGVEIVEGEHTYIIPVKTGMFAGGRVEVSGEGLAEGVTVGVAR
jgi:peptidoglycan hydrolase-like protein with peptidoglycan-binding domain